MQIRSSLRSRSRNGVDPEQTKNQKPNDQQTPRAGGGQRVRDIDCNNKEVERMQSPPLYCCAGAVKPGYRADMRAAVERLDTMEDEERKLIEPRKQFIVKSKPQGRQQSLQARVSS